MATKPSRTESMESGDSIVIYQSQNGDYRILDQQGFIDFINDNITSSKPTTLYYAPTATAFNASIDAISNSAFLGKDSHLILTPTGAFALGTITLPASATAKDKQTLFVNTTQAVTSLVIGLNGATAALGVPTTLAENAYFMLKFDAILNTWYRVG